jgi:hypothetical protein
MVLLARSALAREALHNVRTVSVRNVHIENTVGNVSRHCLLSSLTYTVIQNMPFKYKGHPKAFAAKVYLF